MKKIILTFIFLILGSSLYAQVGIYPQAVFLDMKNRSTYMKIMNHSNDQKEVTLDLVFGYPGFDSLGNVVTYMGDSLPQADYSASPYVRLFPKKLQMKPGEEQVVKFMVGNANKAKDGTYFSRIVIVSKKPPQEIDTNYSEGKITAQLDMNFTLVSALIFEKGERNCDINVAGASSFTDTSKVNILFDFVRGGNSPFLGMAEVNVYDEEGDHVADTKEMSPVYFSGRKAFKFEKDKFKNGTYRVDIELSNDHKDVPEDFRIPFKPVKKTFYVEVEGNI